MLVRLKDLIRNPMRDLIVDPIDRETVQKLKASIDADGFWGGVVCRKRPDGKIEIAAGHHRVDAAIEAGIEKADIHIRHGETDDGQMVLVYARENATQRSDIGTARTGSVAGAIRYLSKQILIGNDLGIPKANGIDISKSLDRLKESLLSSKGIGNPIIVKFFDGIPGMNTQAVQQALENLRSSGHYARIIEEVKDEIEAEAVEAERAAEAERDAKKAAAKKKKAEAKRKASDDATTAANAAGSNNGRIFDFEGVSRHLKNAHQIDVFRTVVTGQGVAPLLPVEQHEELARQLVALAAEMEEELTGFFIKQHIINMLINAKREARTATDREREELLRRDLDLKMRDNLRGFSGAIRTLAKYGDRITEALESWPADLPFPSTTEFECALPNAKKAIDGLLRALRGSAADGVKGMTKLVNLKERNNHE